MGCAGHGLGRPRAGLAMDGVGNTGVYIAGMMGFVREAYKQVLWAWI
jgi:hypothetical protein